MSAPFAHSPIAAAFWPTPRAESTTPTVLVCEGGQGNSPLLADVIGTHCAGITPRIVDVRDTARLMELAPRSAAAVCVCDKNGVTRFDALGRILAARGAGSMLPVLALAPADMPQLADESLTLGATDALLTAPGYLDQLPLAVRKMLRVAQQQCKEAERLESAQRVAHMLREEKRVLTLTVDRLENLAATDPLTGLANRRTIDARLTELLSAANRHDLPLSVLAIDVDGLKLVNDTFGHAAGDDLLEVVADVLHGACRTSDVAGRLGGDEFVVILPHTDAQRAMVVAERAIRSFAQRAEGVRERLRALTTHTPAFAQGVVHVVGRRSAPQRGAQGVPGLSMGLVAREKGMKADAARLLAQADDALYRAKLGGRGRAVAGDVRVVVRTGERTAA